MYYIAVFQGQRTVYRLTLVKAWNTDEIENYAQLVKLGNPDFIEIKVCVNSLRFYVFLVTNHPRIYLVIYMALHFCLDKSLDLLHTVHAVSLFILFTQYRASPTVASQKRAVWQWRMYPGTAKSLTSYKSWPTYCQNMRLPVNTNIRTACLSRIKRWVYNNNIYKETKKNDVEWKYYHDSFM